jgi:hypothetical protein
LPPYAVLVTCREILQKEPAVDDLHAILKKYQRNEVILFLGKLNCLLGNWKNEPAKELDRALSNYVLQKYRARLDLIRKGPNVRIVFSRLTLLYLVKQACLVCPETGLNLTSEQGRTDVGVCCLMANDLVLPFVPNRSNSILQKLANILPFADYISADHYPMEIARTVMILEDILQSPALKAESNYIDLAALFENHFGFSAKTFCHMVFGCATLSIQATPETLQKAPDALLLRDTFFQHSVVAPETAKKFFTKLTIPEAEFAKQIQDAASRPGDDLTIIQKFPLIEIVPNRYLCLDPGFLIEKAGRGFYWSLFSELNSRLQSSLPPFWGTVFEDYVNHIVQESYKGRGRFVPQPRFPNGDASFDACIVEGRDLVVFEHKSSVIRADAKYGGDINRLEKELLLKFIHGEGKEKKGVSQISHSLVRFFSGENLADINSQDISRVFPVIVGLENCITVPFMARYFRENFKAIYPRKKFPKVVTPLFTLGVADVENLLGYLSAFTFPEILESYHSAEPQMMSAISFSGVPLLNNTVPVPNIVKERFSDFGRQMEKDLFGVTDAT